MVKEFQYTTIRRVLDNLLDHPMLRNVTAEQAVRYTIRFISLHGFPKMFQDKAAEVEIHNFRGMLPCDLISIIQVRDKKCGLCLKAMTDVFPGAQFSPPEHAHEREHLHEKKHKHLHDLYIPERRVMHEEPSFKTQGRVLFTSFPEGCVDIAYRSIPVDEDGFPLLIDNENYLAALEAFIKLQVFTIQFDLGKISGSVLQNAQQDYAWRAAELGSEFMTPSVSEAESLSRMYNTLIMSVHHFDHGFKNVADREYLRRH